MTKIYFTKYFKSQLKKLKKKYPNVKKDLLGKLGIFDLDKEIHVGRSIYKVRIKSSDQSKGKSSGFRSYVYLYRKKDLLVPLCIYHKGQRVSISENELKYYFDRAVEEFLER